MRGKVSIGVVLVVAALAALPAGAHAFRLTVTTTADEFTDPAAGTGCSLREAIEAMNLDDASYGGCVGTDVSPEIGDFITVPPGTYTRSITGEDESNASGDFDIYGDVAITGSFAPGVPTEAPTIQGTGTEAGDRLFDVHDTYLLNLGGLELRAGRTGGRGGGIQVNGLNARLIMTRVTLAGNASDEYGGAVANLFGSVRMNGVTVSGNSAAIDGGGLDADVGGDYVINNSTIAGNVADADNAGGGSGGGIASEEGTFDLYNSIVAGNTDLSPSPTNAPDCRRTNAGIIKVRGYDLIGNLTGCDLFPDIGPGLVANVDAKLGPLTRTLPPTGLLSISTHALLPTSPAIDAGNPALSDHLQTPPTCDYYDQHFRARNLAGRCDMGAFETPGVAPVPQRQDSRRKCAKKRKKKPRGKLADSAKKKKKKKCKKRKKPRKSGK
jgi:CSLREA domain-containing protein